MSLNTVLKEMLSQIDDINNLNIIEHETDIEKQEEFLNFWKENDIKESRDIDQDIKSLSEEKEHELVKILLFKLALSEEPKAFRALEKYNDEIEGELKEWAEFALHESRMKMESTFSDQDKVYLSTGLGGKSRKLRYFCVLPAREGIDLSIFQQGVVEKEVQFSFSTNDIELEEISLYEDFACLVCLIPIVANVHSIFKDIINECNNLGGFMDDSYVLSNVKRLTAEEVRTLLIDGDVDFEDEIYDDFDEIEGSDKDGGII